MVLTISSVHQVGATASGVDKKGHGVQVPLTAYVIDAGDAPTAISVVEAQVLNEAVIPDGTGGFTTPTLVTVNSLQSSLVLPVAPLIYRHTGGGDEKLPVSSIYDVQAVASIPSIHASTTIDVFPLNTDLSASIALAEGDILTMPIVKDPFVPGKFDRPQKVVVNSASPVPSAPSSGPILIPTVVIPDWPDEETIEIGGGGLPSAGALGLKTTYVFVPNDGHHSERDVASLSPPAGSTVPVGSLVTVSLFDAPIPTVVIPDWPDEETVEIGGGGLPSAGALGLKTTYVFVPNDGHHSERDVASLSPPAGSTVPVGSLVTVSLFDAP